MKRFSGIGLIAVLLLMLLTPLVWAQETASEPAQKQEAKPTVEKPVGGTGGLTALPEDDTLSFMKSFLALTFVLGLIFLSAYFYKKMTGIRTGLRGNRIGINMVGNLPLGDKRFLAVIEIQGKLFLVGITPNAIEMLSELDIELPEGALTGTGSEGDFENIFQKARSLLQKGVKK